MTGNVQLYLTGDSLHERPRMGAHLVGFGWGVKWLNSMGVTVSQLTGGNVSETSKL